MVALCSLPGGSPRRQLSSRAGRQVPVYAAAVARARLQRLMARLAAALRGGAGAPASAWPPPRALLLLKLWATVFPASDRRHAVLTPAALLLGACLALCPLARAADVAHGAPPARTALPGRAPPAGQSAMMGARHAAVSAPAALTRRACLALCPPARP